MTPRRDARALLRKYGLRAKKSWGQNFLVDDNVGRRIVAACDLSRDDVVVEIGAGLGTLTERLADAAVGLEAKIRHGQLLKRLGYAMHARNVFEQALVHAKRFKLKHEEEQAWVSVAKKELAQ